jgi:ABC-type Mn2+/Zn2+ transport system ATPase subunit
VARAIYQKADFYLLDDPLSAVDMDVAQHLFDQVVGPNGMLANQTRFVTMNSTKYLSQCDFILVIKGNIYESSQNTI